MTLQQAVDRAGLLLGRGRRLLGIAGAPGAGKSVLAEALVAALGPRAVLVAMDGFHLDDRVLRAHGSWERKGAPETFDADGYLALLQRLRTADRPVYAPLFDRGSEQSVAGAIEVGPEIELVVTEGNYLLLDREPWSQVAGLLDECWFLAPPEDVRTARLVERHRRHGRSEDGARDRASGPDQRNAELVLPTAARADWRLAVADLGAATGPG
ncbi:nucleoside/nucleotide kinase family protein [Desertihabitans brevis]|uniref:Nucleoside/nucleotide kinase family protein n=1 Tax=Desertihabitans brevis TaxID=2268447 RepID=A0A367YSB0_9ACTN|nr:nucleoside/nucleotide kinase family protein [Desertihabitans brevis]RCK68708.1 nucleoside/nucleotide kinase family protein [Desertihabitans brevis]